MLTCIFTSNKTIALVVPTKDEEKNELLARKCFLTFPRQMEHCFVINDWHRVGVKIFFFSHFAQCKENFSPRIWYVAQRALNLYGCSTNNMFDDVRCTTHKKKIVVKMKILFIFLFVFIYSVCVWHTIERDVVVWKSVHWTVTRMPIARFFFVERSRGYHIHVCTKRAYKATGWNSDATKLMA